MMKLPGRSLASLRALPNILLFGDSITEFGFGQNGQVGWASLLASTYTRRADVVSRGYSGYNTEHALSVLPSILGSSSGGSENYPTSKVPLLFSTVFFGANDASLPTARQHLPLEDYCENIREIVTTIRSHVDDETNLKQEKPTPFSNHHHQTPIIMFTPPPVSPKAWDHFCTVTSPRPLSPRSNAQCKLYGTKLKEIGREMDCSIVDTYQLLGGDKGEEYYKRYLVDGIHLNGEGNRIVYDGLMEVIKEELGDRGILPLEEGADSGVPLDQKLWSEMC